MKRLAAVTSTLLLVSTGSTVLGAAAPASASCSHANTYGDGRYGNFFEVSNASIRTGPHTSCGVVAYGQTSHLVDYYCFVTGDSVTANGRTSNTWTYLRDVTTGYKGWVSDTLLWDWGSDTTC
ncbi:hypothetical protein BSA16_01195 [Micromonospora sp. Rc5]|nr:hypothetical protein BSA16_01195 [Micromonospora sp. Rc5]